MLSAILSTKNVGNGWLILLPDTDPCHEKDWIEAPLTLVRTAGEYEQVN